MPMRRSSAIALLVLACLSWNALADTTLRAPRAVVWKDFLGVNAQFQYFPPASTRSRWTGSMPWA